MGKVTKRQIRDNLIKMLTDGINNQSGDKQNDMLPIELLVPYPNHPFKLYEGERFTDMVRSIKEMGVLLPIIVRPFFVDDEEGEMYEILSGHNRVNAAREAGLEEIPSIIRRDLSDEEAILIVTETNLRQRGFESLSYSERAIALKYHMDAIIHQGKRTDLIEEINSMLNIDNTVEISTCAQNKKKSKSRDKIAAKYELGHATVSRYLRLCELSRDFLDKVDNDEIGLYAAMLISYLKVEEQNMLNEVLDGNKKYKIDIKKAEALREFSKNKKLTNENILKILSGEFFSKKKPGPPPPIRIKYKIYSKYFGEKTTQSEMEAVIEKALEEYFNNNKNNNKSTKI